MAAEVESMFSVREVPWHGLGTIVKDAPNSKEAIKLAGLDWLVVSRKIIDSVTGEEIPKFAANVREIDNKVLGIVNDSRYNICQNVDAFEFTDKILGEGVTYETAGSLLGGRKIWLLAKLPERDILGDDYSPYLVFTNSHDGSGSVKAAITPVRVVCQNTLNIGLRRAERMWCCHHRGNLQDKLHEAMTTLSRSDWYLENLEKEFSELNGLRFDDGKAEDYISKLFPIKKEDSKKKVFNTKKIRDEVLYRYKEAPDLAGMNRGGYRLLNAVSDYITHTNPIRKTKYYQENLFLRTISGGTILDKTYGYLRDAA